jgi:hypothetical protein
VRLGTLPQRSPKKLQAPVDLAVPFSFCGGLQSSFQETVETNVINHVTPSLQHDSVTPSSSRELGSGDESLVPIAAGDSGEEDEVLSLCAPSAEFPELGTIDDWLQREGAVLVPPFFPVWVPAGEYGIANSGSAARHASVQSPTVAHGPTEVEGLAVAARKEA